MCTCTYYMIRRSYDIYAQNTHLEKILLSVNTSVLLLVNQIPVPHFHRFDLPQDNIRLHKWLCQNCLLLLLLLGHQNIRSCLRSSFALYSCTQIGKMFLTQISTASLDPLPHQNFCLLVCTVYHLEICCCLNIV